MAMTSGRPAHAMRLPSALISPLLVGWLLSALAVACGDGSVTTGPSLGADAPTPPPRPADCREIAPTEPLQQILDQAAEGDVLCLSPGRHPGPVEVRTRVHVWGSPEAIVASTGKGTTVLVTAPGSRLSGFVVDGSGGRFDILDAAVKVHADDVHLEGLTVRNATFGILAEQTHRVRIVDCTVQGDATAPHGMRGDAIRLWETYDAVVENNRVFDGRDMVVWYSSRNRLARNTVTGGRYGTHFMYSHGNQVVGNRYVGNVVGIFVMYSRDVEIARNLIADSAGAAGIGIGVKESGNLRVHDNSLLHNTRGIYLDTSPLHQDDFNVFERNLVQLGDTGVVFHSSERRNRFEGNAFRDNRQQVRVEGGGHALDVEWVGNDFDDYAGYDLDGDGFGDFAYELRSLSAQVTGKHPELAFFTGLPALWLVEAVGKAVPLLAPKTLVRDPRPRMGIRLETFETTGDARDAR